MAYDIAALAERYGSVSHNAGNGDVYNAASLGVDGTGMTAQTIVDTGGSNDTIDLSGISGNHIIDLRQAIDSTGNWAQSNDPMDGLAGARTVVAGHEYIYIAQGSVIENAIGGSSADQLIGNDANNILNPGTGADLSYGGKGDDTFIAADSLNGTAGGHLEGDLYNGGGFSGGNNGDAIAYAADGIDKVNFSALGFGIKVDLSDPSNGTAYEWTSGGGTTGTPDTLKSIESIVGTTHDDYFTAFGQHVVIDGGGGNDTFVLYTVAGRDQGRSGQAQDREGNRQGDCGEPRRSGDGEGSIFQVVARLHRPPQGRSPRRNPSRQSPRSAGRDDRPHLGEIPPARVIQGAGQGG